MSVNPDDSGGNTYPECILGNVRQEAFGKVDLIGSKCPMLGRIYEASAGDDTAAATSLVRATLGKSDLPEPLRLAHLIARAIVTGESRGQPRINGV